MSVNIDESLCARCVHIRRLIIPEMKKCFSLKCTAIGRYIKTPRRSCGYFEPETWEKFLDAEAGGNNED